MTAENGPSQSSPSPAEAAAREPSMDDILASIRRIIADDDVLPLSRPRAAASGGAPAPASRPPAPMAAAGDSAPGLRQKLFRGVEAAPDSTGGAAPAPVFRPPAPRVVSVADKAPSLNLRDFAPAPRPQLRDAPKISAPEPPQAETSAKAPDAPEPKAEPSESAPREDAPAIAEAPRKATAAAMAPPPAPAVASPPAPAVAPQPAATVAQLPEARLKAAAPAPEPPAGVEPPAPVAETPAESSRPATRRVPAPQVKGEADEPVLLSSASGARIGASFEALAESLMLRDPEMIERVAREMLRPMLKAWLDDNLPVVVERLVRAEIERIARGRG